MNVEMEKSIQSVIDPELHHNQEPTSPASLLTAANVGATPTPLALKDTPTTPDSSAAPLMKSGRQSKVKPVVPGSAADFRRREANRLAAERSRSRLHDKVFALDHAAKTLTEENERLREQIAQLEGEGHGHADPADADGTAGRETGAEIEASANVHGHGQGQTQEQQEQQEHSHTILAALTDIAGVDFSAEANDSWMQGMENFLKDPEATGRLGELAAVATGRDDSSAVQAVENHPLDHLSTPHAPHNPDDRTATASIKKPRSAISAAQLANPANAVVVMAAAINTEMERLIMEDLADTKAAIVALEKQLSLIRDVDTSEFTDELQAQAVQDSTRLPSSIFSDDTEQLQASVDGLQSDIAKLESDLPALRDELVKLRDQRVGEQGKVSEIVKELQKLVVEADEEEKEKLMQTLRDVGGFVRTLLVKEGEQNLSSDLPPNLYSSPALARRRRGRPPKNSAVRALYPSVLLTPSSRSKSEEETKVKSKKRPRKSRLSQVETDNGQTKTDHAQQRQRLERNAAPGAAPETATEQEPAPEVIAAEPSTHVDNEATVEAVNRAILSQLASHQTPGPSHSDVDVDTDHTRPHGMTMDSTSFADFLPAQEELERQAGVSAAADDGIMVSATQESEQGQGAGAGVGDEEPSVLSRLKQGPAGSCDICGRMETTVWRKLKLGGEDLKVCNACGLYHTKFGVIRPYQLWGDGRSLKKRRSTIRLSTGEGAEVDNGEGTGEAGRESGASKKKQKGNKGKAVAPSPSPLTNQVTDVAGSNGQDEGEGEFVVVDEGEIGDGFGGELLSPDLEREVQELHDQQQAMGRGDEGRGDSPGTVIANVFGMDVEV